MPAHLRVGPAGAKGRGVFAKKGFKAGAVVEECPIILLAGSDAYMAVRTILHEYMYAWNEDDSAFALALGYGSLYNHDNNANATWRIDYGQMLVRIIAVKFIRKGQEITIAYRPDERPG
jgi:SET domain-containing protein